MKTLADIDTIEILQISYVPVNRFSRANVNWNFQETPDLGGSDMRHFSHLKALKISGFDPDKGFQHATVCAPLTLLNVYGPQILSNVENLTLVNGKYNMEFIKFVVKLRYLCINISLSEFNQAGNILATLENILQQRRNGQNEDDFIELKFSKQNGSNGCSLKLTAPTTS